MTVDSLQLPLEGIRVLDLSGSLGSYCARTLADIGADVVKVEPPGGDESRRSSPFAGNNPDIESSLTFAYYQSNKRGVIIDFGRAEALGQLEEIGKNCDVVILTPTTRHPVAGFDPATGKLSWAPSDAVVCSITPFGLSGPYRSWRATQFTSHALSGLMYTSGPSSNPASVAPGQLLYDYVGGHSSVAILSALRARPFVGGQLIDMSAHEVLTQSNPMLYRYTCSSDIARRVDRGLGTSKSRWACKDGLVEISVFTDKHWFGLVELLGKPSEFLDPSWGHPRQREKHADLIVSVMGPLIAEMTREDFVSRGQNLGVPCAPINSPGDFIKDPQIKSRNFFIQRNRDGIGDFLVAGAPFISVNPVVSPNRRNAPHLGEHDAAVIAHAWSVKAQPVVDAAVPLAGIRILSFGTAIAGAFSATVLAELGADVVKIESPVRPDNVRRGLSPSVSVVHEPSGADTSTEFAAYNRTVRSLTLDMKQPDVVELFLRLLKVSDVVIENFGPGVMDRWGLSYEQISEANPKVVMLSLSGIGHTGPRRNYLGYATTVSAFSGLTSVWDSGGAFPDYMGVAHGVFGVLAALAARDRTGQGNYLDLAEDESAAVGMGPLLLDYSVNGHETKPKGNWAVGNSVSGVVPCVGDDRWLAIELEDRADWISVVNLVQCSDVSEDAFPPEPNSIERFVTALSRWAGLLTPNQAMRKMQNAGIAAAAVQNIEDVVNDPQHRTRQFLLEMNHPDLGVAEYAAPVHRLVKTPPKVLRPTPRLGEHTAEVLVEWLGMSAEEAAPYAWPASANRTDSF